MAEFETVAELVAVLEFINENEVKKDGVTEVRLRFPDYIKNDPIRNAVEIKALAKFLKSNASITKLELSGNGIDDAGAKYIAGALKINTSITELDLENNYFEEEGTRDIAEALRTNTSITHFSLRDNRIYGGVKYISEALRTNTSIKELNLINVCMDNKGAKYIAGALKTNMSIEWLWMFDNEIDDAIKNEIDETVARNKKLNQPENIAYQCGVVEGVIAEASKTSKIDLPQEIISYIASFTKDANKVELHRDARVCKSAAESGSRAKAVVESRNGVNVRQ